VPEPNEQLYEIALCLAAQVARCNSCGEEAPTYELNGTQRSRLVRGLCFKCYRRERAACPLVGGCD
jgi:hypothetical protein